MQYVPIKHEVKNDKDVYLVNAISLKNSTNSVVQKIPHPFGTDFLEFETLEDAKDSIVRAGFSYMLPDGKKGHSSSSLNSNSRVSKSNLKDIVYSTILNKVNSSNPTVCAAAIIAICEFPNDETFDILFKKIGEENDLIRKNAISGVCRYSQVLQPRIISALKDDNWVARNSALICIKNLAQDNNIDYEKFIPALIDACADQNPIVESNAISTLGVLYQNYMKNS